MRNVSSGSVMCGVVAGCLALTVTGCQSSSTTAPESMTATPSSAQSGARTPAVSTAGQVDYACALARDVRHDPGEFNSSNFAIGDGASAAEYEVGGAQALLGAPLSAQVKGHEDLSRAAMTIGTGITNVDLKKLNTGVATLSDRCAKRGLPAGHPDISGPGRVAYACALISDVQKNHDPVSSWTFRTDDAADPGEFEAAGASGLLGSMTGSHLAGHRAMSDAAMQIYRGLSTLDVHDTQRGIDAFAKSCRHA